MERVITTKELREQERLLELSAKCYRRTYNQIIDTKMTVSYIMERIPKLEEDLRALQVRLPKLQEQLRTLEITLPSNKRHKDKLAKKVELLKKKLKIERQLQTIK